MSFRFNIHHMSRELREVYLYSCTQKKNIMERSIYNRIYINNIYIEVVENFPKFPLINGWGFFPPKAKNSKPPALPVKIIRSVL